MWKMLKILGGALSILALSGGFYINSQRAEILEKALATVEETASKTLGVPVKIGSVDLNKINIWEFNKNSDIIIHDLEIFDKNSELLAKVKTTDVNFKLIALKDDPVAALDEIKISGAQLNLKKRDENSWNINDIELKNEGESTFDAKIYLEHGMVNADFDGKNITVEEISGEADCADMNAIATKLSTKILDAQVKASGTLSSEQQVINAEVDNLFFDKILTYLPEDKIPEGVEILHGTAQNISLHLLRKGETLSYLGSTQIKNAFVKVEATNVENITGTITFNEREVVLDGTMTANGQYAAASGKIRLDTDETFFDIYAESDNFTPAAIIEDIGIIGAADIRAHLVGTTKNPQVDADIHSDWLAYEDYSAQNISTKLRYLGDMIYLSDTSANIFGGNVTGIVEIKTEDLTFNAHVLANGLDAATLCDFANSDNVIDGKFFADLGINGGGDKPTKIYGTAKAMALDVEGLKINEANASFYFAEDNLTIDYLSANLPDNGTLGLEGTITDMNQLDLNFYGAHVDMSIAKKFNSALDMSGLADFKGTVRGESDNPDVTLLLSAVDNSKREGKHFTGKLFKQPFDSIRLMASGSLDGVHIDDFVLEKDGAAKWTIIEGNVGLTGEKSVNIQLDTTAIRAEDIAALVAPDQEITGNVSNTVKITGTIEKPQVAGNIKFNRGSYRGVILSGMTGDYFLEGEILRLQDFEITSPMVDMVLNGTINKNTQVMDFVVEGKDINLQRFKGKLPEKYNAEGHIKFEGLIKGTPDIPIFSGELTADEILLNGVSLTNVYGHLESNGANVYLEDFYFNDGDGNCQMQLSTNLDNKMISGEADVTDADIAHMFTIADVKNELIEGKLNSKILIGGTLDRLRGSLTGEISQGTFATYDIHDIKVALNLLNNSIYVNQLEGKQGDKGTINLLGSATLDGAIDMKLSAKEIPLDLFSKAASLDMDMVGTSNIEVQLGGTMDNPSGNATVTATGGIKGSTFDLLKGCFILKDWRVNVEELMVQRELGGKIYGANVKGFVPLKAILAKSKENLPDNEQLNLTLSLDEADLSLLPVISSYIVFGVGELNGALKITGTAAHPQFNGQISLNDGSVKVKGMKSLIEHINISTLFKGESFDVETFSGNIGSGTFTLTGGFNFPGLEFKDYNFDLEANNLDIDSDYFDGLFNAKFNFREELIRHWSAPKLSGQINLDKCRISMPSIPDSDEPLPNVLLDIELNLGAKIHFYSSHLYDMYFTGNAKFEGTTLHPKPSGIINVKRGGTLTYLESVFNIREGEAHFNQMDTFMPSLHFFAETKIDRTKIFLSVNGSPDNMKFKLSSSPEMNETEILRLLTLREAYSDGEGNLSTADALAIGLQMTVLADIEDALKKTIGIDQFTVSRGSGSMFERHTPGERDRKDKEDYNVKIGKYVNDNLMLKYTRGFGSHKVDRYGLQYDFNDNLGFTIEREGKDYIFSFEARYKF